MAVDDSAGGTPAISRGGLAGPLLAVLGGALVAVSALLPWVQLTFSLPHGQGTYQRIGLELTNGVLVFAIGVLTAVLGGGMVVARGARAPGALCVAVAAALVVALTGGWWFRGYGTFLTGLGVLVCLAAAAVLYPGSPGRRAGLLAGAAVVGVALAVVMGLLVPFQTPAF